jgi:polyisoprenoid-binding protein YceI
MKRNIIIAGNVALLLLAALSVRAADSTLYRAKPGSKMRIEGTSSIHDWQVEGVVIGGTLEAGAGFPTEPGQAATPGKVEAKADAKIPVRSLKSVEADGRPYNDAMDKVMWEHLHEDTFPAITYHLSELVLKETAASKDAPYVLDSTGDLAIAGVTNKVSFPVNVLPLGDGKLKVTGTIKVKMTDYKVDPPNPLHLGIKTGDDVKLIFTWILAKTPAAAAK